MKTKLFFIAALAAIMLNSIQKVNAQNWILNGNGNVTDTSKLGSKNNKPVRFVAKNTEWMRLTTAGNLGVGTTTPDTRLHVVTSGSVPATFDGGGTNMYIALNEGGVYRGYLGSYAGALTDMDFGTGVGNSTGKLHLTIQASPKLTIDANGNVGIGTTTPSAKLHVTGNIKIDGANSFEFGAGLTKEINAGKIGYGNITPGELDIVGAGTNITNRKIKFWSEGGAEFTGNISIGTAISTYRLDVAGNTRFNPAGNVDFLISSDGKDPVFKPTFAAYGYVGTDSFPMYKIYAQTFFASSTSAYQVYSDSRIKENIKPISNALSLVGQLRPVTYDLTKQFFYRGGNSRLNENDRINQPGFIAQQIEKVFPQLVATDNSGLKTVGYVGLIPVLTEAIQEQQKQIEDLKQTVEKLLEKININTDNNNSNARSNTIKLDNASLEQNIPNPFTNTTVINYTLPQKFNTAQIIITDNNGKTIKQINISGAGKGSLTVDASTLIQGAYHYALFADGKMIGTKQMVLAK